MGNCVPSTEALDAEDLELYEECPFMQELHDACAQGDAMHVQELLAKGANPDAVDPETDGTALMIAATIGSSYVLGLLIEAGADIDRQHPTFEMTALLWACNNAHLRCVELLIEAGADKTITEVSGETSKLCVSMPSPGLLGVGSTQGVYAGLNGRELATENMRQGWEKVVDFLGDDTDGGQSFEQERAL
jgi:ankyrin repeat protein